MGSSSEPDHAPLAGSERPSDASENNKRLVRQFTDAVNRRDREAIERVCAPDVRRVSPSTPDAHVSSVAELWEFLQQDFGALPDSRVTLDALVADDERVGLWATYSGTQTGPMGPFPPSGQRVSAEFSGIVRIRNGRIAEMRVVWDNLDFLSQLGHLPGLHQGPATTPPRSTPKPLASAPSDDPPPPDSAPPTRARRLDRPSRSRSESPGASRRRSR